MDRAGPCFVLSQKKQAGPCFVLSQKKQLVKLIYKINYVGVSFSTNGSLLNGKKITKNEVKRICVTNSMTVCVKSILSFQASLLLKLNIRR